MKISKFYMRGRKKNKGNKNNTNDDGYSVFLLRQRYNLFRNYVIETMHLQEKFQCDLRLPNPPEDITENIVKFLIRRELGDPTCVWCKGVDGKTGDLFSQQGGLYEVKAFTSDGPCSFGPKKKFDCLFFLDMRRWLENHFVLWRFHLSNASPLFQNIPINAKNVSTSMQDKCDRGLRPHVCFQRIFEFLHDKKDSEGREICTKIYEGTFEDIFIPLYKEKID
jgi:hypothetical protein